MLAMVGIARISVRAEIPEETNSLGMELRLLEGERFVRGTDAREHGLTRAFPLSSNAQFFGNPEYPRHVTWITKPFWMGAREVTLGQWKAFVEDTGYVTTAERSGGSRAVRETYPPAGRRRQSRGRLRPKNLEFGVNIASAGVG